MATKTFTFPASQKYTDKNGKPHVITTSQTFTMDMTDDGTTARYTGLSGNKITMTSGENIVLEGDPAFSFMNITADGSAVKNAGAISFRETDNSLNSWNINSVTIDDADVPTTCTMILERKDSPMVTITWTTLTVA